MSQLIDDQVGLVFGALEVPDDWRERMSALAVSQDGGVDVSKLHAKRKRVVRAFLDENIQEDEYQRRLAVIDGQVRAAQPTSLPNVQEAAGLFNDLPALWAGATNEERQRLLAPLIDRVYVDVELHQVAAITPAPAFRTLLEGALTRSRHAACLVMSPDQAARWWRWWRRGRIELPVQRRAGLRHYRRFRRLSLVQRVVAGPASPDRADSLRRSVSASDRSTPTNRRRTTARRGEACGRRHRVSYAARANSRSPIKSLPQFNEGTAPRPAPQVHASLSKPVVPSAPSV